MSRADHAEAVRDYQVSIMLEQAEAALRSSGISEAKLDAIRPRLEQKIEAAVRAAAAITVH